MSYAKQNHDDEHIKWIQAWGKLRHKNEETTYEISSLTSWKNLKSILNFSLRSLIKTNKIIQLKFAEIRRSLLNKSSIITRRSSYLLI